MRRLIPSMYGMTDERTHTRAWIHRLQRLKLRDFGIGINLKPNWFTYLYKKLQILAFWDEAWNFFAKSLNIWKILHPLTYLILLNCFSDPKLSFFCNNFYLNINIFKKQKSLYLRPKAKKPNFLKEINNISYNYYSYLS